MEKKFIGHTFCLAFYRGTPSSVPVLHMISLSGYNSNGQNSYKKYSLN